MDSLVKHAEQLSYASKSTILLLDVSSKSSILYFFSFYIQIFFYYFWMLEFSYASKRFMISISTPSHSVPVHGYESFNMASWWNMHFNWFCPQSVFCMIGRNLLRQVLKKNLYMKLLFLLSPVIRFLCKISLIKFCSICLLQFCIVWPDKKASYMFALMSTSYRETLWGRDWTTNCLDVLIMKYIWRFTKLEAMGGLGLRKTSDMNSAAMAGLCWRVRK